MPANQITHDVKNGKGTKKGLEKKWKEAKDIVKDEYGTTDNKWGVVQKIYQNKRDKKKASLELNAAFRILSNYTVKADSFEGWVNSLGFKYNRPNPDQDCVTFNISLQEVYNKLKSNEWKKIKDIPLTLEKGDHSIRLEPYDDNNKTRLIGIK
jgi:hypothetical protein